MFQRLFGYTVEEQLGYLQSRLFFIVLAVIIAFILALIGGNGSIALVLAAYMWGWGFMRNWFGITTIGAIFSGNLVIGFIIVFIYLIVGYFLGLITFVIGLIRYIQLKLFYVR